MSPCGHQNRKIRIMKLNRLGYIIAGSLIALGLNSCNKESVSPEESQYPIVFGGVDTRASAALDDVKAGGFKVYAYLSGNTGKSTTFEKEVNYNSSDNTWWYEGIQYWIPETNYSFKAFYPKSFTAGTLTVDNTSSSQSYSVTNFDITKQEDIMVASATASVPADALYPTTGSVVNLQFQHLLACIVVELKSEIDAISVTSVKLSDVMDYATFVNGHWESTNKASITYTGETALTKNANYVDVTGGGLLVVPGSSNGVSLTIKANKEYTVALPPISWEGGKKYTYTGVIKQNDIIFNEPGVKLWDSDSATGSVIIK